MQIKHKYTVLFTALLFLLMPFIYSQESIVEYRTIVDEPELRIDTYGIQYIPIVSEREDFTATSSKADLDLCVLTEQHDIIKVTNTGTSYSDYELNLGGSAAPYVTSVPNRFSLMPSESTFIYTYFRFPGFAKGKYDLKVNIKTNTGLEKEFTQKIISNLCDNNYLLAINFNQTATPCLDMVYDFSIKNLGSHIETYSFGLDRFSEYAKISANPLVLAPGEEETISLNLNLDCAIYGDYILNFYSNAQSTDVTMKVPILVNIKKYYDYNIKTGNLLDNDDKKLDASFVSMKNYKICGGHNKSIQLMVDNPSYIGNNFFYSLDGPEWGTLYGDTMSLNGYEKGYTYLDLTPSKETIGEYKFIINVNSQRGNEKKQKIVDIEIIDCYGLIVDIPQKEVLPNCKYSELEFDVQNTGKFNEEVILEVEGPDYVSLDSSSLEIPKGETSKSKLKIWPPCNIKEIAKINIKATLQDEKAYAEDTLELKIATITKAYSLKFDSESSIRLTNESKIIPIKVIHNGLKEAFYSIEPVGLDWIKTDAINFTLAPGETYSFNILASPDNVPIGNYYADLNLKTDNVVYQKKLTFKIREGKSFIETVSDFLHYWRYWFYTGIVVLVLLVILSIYFKEKARVWKIKKLIKNSMKKDKEEKKSTEKKKANKKQAKEKKKSFKWISYLITFVIIAAIVCLAVGYTNYCLIIISYAISFIFEYIWYIIAGLLLTMIIISILNKVEK